MVTAYCYMEPFGEFADLESAKTAVEQHILTCPEDAMPWAISVWWHQAGEEWWCSSSDDEWLSHDVRPARVRV